MVMWGRACVDKKVDTSGSQDAWVFQKWSLGLLEARMDWGNCH